MLLPLLWQPKILLMPNRNGTKNWFILITDSLQFLPWKSPWKSSIMGWFYILALIWGNCGMWWICWLYHVLLPHFPWICCKYFTMYLMRSVIFFSNIILCQNKCAMFDKALHKRLKVNKKCLLYGRKNKVLKKNNSHSVRPYFKTKSLTFRRLLNCTFFRKLCLLCFQCAVHNIYNIHIASTCTQYLLRIKCFDTGAKILSWIHCCKHTIHILDYVKKSDHVSNSIINDRFWFGSIDDSV